MYGTILEFLATLPTFASSFLGVTQQELRRNLLGGLALMLSRNTSPFRFANVYQASSLHVRLFPYFGGRKSVIYFQYQAVGILTCGCA